MSPFINDHPAEANVPTNDFKARNTTAGSPFHETSVHDYTPSDPKERTSFFALIQPPPEPKTELGVYRLLSPSAGSEHTTSTPATQESADNAPKSVCRPCALAP